MYSTFSRYYMYNKTSYQCLIFIVATLFIDDFSEKNNCQIIFLMAELNELLFNSDSDDEQFIGFEAKYVIK